MIMRTAVIEQRLIYSDLYLLTKEFVGFMVANVCNDRGVMLMLFKVCRYISKKGIRF